MGNEKEKEGNEKLIHRKQRVCEQCECNVLTATTTSQMRPAEWGYSGKVELSYRFTQYRCLDCEEVVETKTVEIDWRDANKFDSKRFEKVIARAERRLELLTEMRDRAEKRLQATLTQEE